MVGTANFELAVGAIATARAALNALHWDEETTKFTNLKSKWFRCRMCAYGVRELMIEDLVSTYQSRVEPFGPTTHVQQLRHCQRHPTQSVTHAGDNDYRSQYKEPAERRHSTAELKSGKHNREVVRQQFACVHCRFRNTQTVTGAEATWVEVENPKRMDFNSLRSHLAARYGSSHLLSNSRTLMEELMHEAGD